MLAEQQRFRSALMELSELSYTTEDDDEFYRRLIERAVEVVPGAQGGSVQLNVPGTTKFRFVAAVGFDLAALQLRTLDLEHFFRDAWDPNAKILREFEVDSRTPEVTEWLQTAGRLSEIMVNVSGPVLANGRPVAFLSLDNFEDPDAMSETSIEMTTVLSRLIGELLRRRALEAELRLERAAYRHLAMHDPLTGLANRRNLDIAISEALESAGRRGRPSAVLFVDIDDFKEVNDQLGHEAGDQFLTQVALLLSRAMRAGDMVGRWGGDEFVVVPYRLESPEEAMFLAERILAAFQQDFEVATSVRLRARLSVGIGWTTDSSAEPHELVRAADAALYEAKALGKGRAHLNKV